MTRSGKKLQDFSIQISQQIQAGYLHSQLWFESDFFVSCRSVLKGLYFIAKNQFLYGEIKWDSYFLNWTSGLYSSLWGLLQGVIMSDDYSEAPQTDKPAHIPALRWIAHTQPMLRHLSHQNKPSNPQTHRKPSGVCVCVVLHLWLFIAEAIVMISCNGNIQNALTVQTGI